jgi:hypothetical protein
MAHRFDDKQQIDAQGFLTQATGPVDEGERIFWIVVLVYQQKGEDEHAAAWGMADWTTDPASEKWECSTGMVPGSTVFSNGPAQAWALALVTKAGQTVMYPWSHTVQLV